MKQPLGFSDPTRPNHVCFLHRALYDLKQAPRVCFEKSNNFLIDYGFSYRLADPSLFVYHFSGYIIISFIYVDDIVITGDSCHIIDKLVGDLAQDFPMKDLNPFHFFLGYQGFT